MGFFSWFLTDSITVQVSAKEVAKRKLIFLFYQLPLENIINKSKVADMDDGGEGRGTFVPKSTV